MSEDLREFSRITPNLFLTSAIAVTVNDVKRNHIRLVINATNEWSSRNLGDEVRVVKLPVFDRPTEDLYRYFEYTTALIHSYIREGQNVLVHCMAGVSRSASICMAYLIKYKGMSLAHAYTHVKNRRPRVRPNDGFVAQLKEWERVVAASNFSMPFRYF